MTHLTLALLGSPEIRLDGALIAWPTRKALALLIYLAVEGGVHPREKIATLFWPETPREKSRATLRRTLSFLRDQIGDAWLIAEQDWLGFNFGGRYELDVQGLISAAASRQPAHWQVAVTRYRADFLAGFTLPDTPAFDDWASQQREHLHQCLRQLCAQLVADQTQQGLRHDAISTATRWLALDPLNETVYRHLLELHLAAADRPAALRLYEQYRTMLATEFAAAPSAEMEALAVQAKGDKETGRQEDRKTGRRGNTLLVFPSPCLLVFPSPCLLVFQSAFRRARG